MTSGYGRGYYGAGQLAPQPLRRRGSGWIKVAVVAGVGAAVWFMWPRSPKGAPDFGHGRDEPPPAQPPPTQSPEGQFHGYPPPQPSYETIDQVAQSRGYPSRQAYEDAVVATARDLQDAGGQVSFAAHLQHLTPRLGSGS